MVVVVEFPAFSSVDVEYSKMEVVVVETSVLLKLVVMIRSVVTLPPFFVVASELEEVKTDGG